VPKSPSGSRKDSNSTLCYNSVAFWLGKSASKNNQWECACGSWKFSWLLAYSSFCFVASYARVNMKVYSSAFQPLRWYALVQMRKPSGANDTQATSENRLSCISKQSAWGIFDNLLFGRKHSFVQRDPLWSFAHQHISWSQPFNNLVSVVLFYFCVGPALWPQFVFGNTIRVLALTLVLAFHNFIDPPLLAIFRTKDAKNTWNPFPSKTTRCLIRLRRLRGDSLLEHLWKRENEKAQR